MTLQLRLVDRFGDNGVIAVVICLEEGSVWFIDTWLTSCRVLNRKVERATLEYIVSRGGAAGIQLCDARSTRNIERTAEGFHFK